MLAAIEAGDTAFLDMQLGPLRRVTGLLKARALLDVIEEEFRDGLDQIVLMAWHTAVIDILAAGFAPHGVARIDGSTRPAARQRALDAFQNGKARVFVGQIQAAGEAIDLSAASQLMFVEPSWTPKDMSQAALRITNHQQKRQCLVRVVALADSIDETVMSVLMRKVAAIRSVLGD